MHAYAQKQGPAQRTKPASSSRPGRATVARIHEERSIGNLAVQRSLQDEAGDLDASPDRGASTGFSYDLSRIPARAPFRDPISTITEPIVQRQLEEEEEEEPLQGKFATKGTPAQLQSDMGPPDNRTGMPDQLKAGLEALSGMDLSAVRVHRNSPKPAQLNAQAYAQGQHIHVGPGQEKHLPHEGWHAVQQQQGRVKPTMQARGVSINDDAGLEREADVMGAKALQEMRVCQNSSNAKLPDTFSPGVTVNTPGDLYGQQADVMGAQTLPMNGAEQATTGPDDSPPQPTPTATPSETPGSAPTKDEELQNTANQAVDTETTEAPASDGTARIVIRGDFPRVSPREYWFFNGETPPDYTVATVLSTNRSSGTFNWSVSPHLSLSSPADATPTVTTAARSIARRDAWIRVRHTDPSGTTASARYRVTVLAPHRLNLQGTTHSAVGGVTFHSRIKYKILDQFGDVLPRDVPWNEDFNNDGLHAVTGVRDYPDPRENWGWGPESGWVVPPDNAVDNISRGVPAGRFPTPMIPQSPLTNTKIDHVVGAWFVGSTTIGDGQLVKNNNKWQIYVDHGQHE